jgi:hypothetical protein
MRPRRQGRPDDGNAFLPDPNGGPTGPTDPNDEQTDRLAELMGEEYIASATVAEHVDSDVHDAVVPEELGGPFLEEPAAAELVDDDDPSNPPGTEPAPFPAAGRRPKGD